LINRPPPFTTSGEGERRLVSETPVLPPALFLKLHTHDSVPHQWEVCRSHGATTPSNASTGTKLAGERAVAAPSLYSTMVTTPGRTAPTGVCQGARQQVEGPGPERGEALGIRALNTDFSKPENQLTHDGPNRRIEIDRVGSWVQGSTMPPGAGSFSVLIST